jgi:hypothetical protein
MIADEQEYRVTQEQAQRLVAALEEAQHEPSEPDPGHRQLMRGALESQLADLRAELAEYEARRLAGRATRPH